MDLFSQPKPAGEKALSVTHLFRRMNNPPESQIGELGVEGEGSNPKKQGSGHWYFSLKDEEGQIRCVMFRGKNLQVGFMPQSGDQVEVSASVSMYVPRGDVQLTIHALQIGRASCGDRV